MEFNWYLAVMLAGAGGLVLASYIRHKKAYREHLVCPIGSDCDEVIHSRFSVFFGVPVEFIGILYYAFVAASYAVFYFYGNIFGDLFIFSISIATILAFLFSLYLTFIQFFTIKKLCTWCLVSAGLCTFIFYGVVFASGAEFVPFLDQYKGLIVMLHLVGVALGVGAATITDVFFFRFLKDFKISEHESEVMSILSEVIWMALAILVLTGIGLYLPEAARLNDSPKFLLKVIVVGIIIVNGALLNLFVSPKLIRITFHQRHEHEPGELHHLRRVAFAMGGISIVSWYSAFILGMLRRVPWSFGQMFLAYILLIAAAIIFSQVMERKFVKMASEQSGGLE